MQKTQRSNSFSEIVVRTTGDIALEDETVNDIDGFVGHGYVGIKWN